MIGTAGSMVPELAPDVRQHRGFRLAPTARRRAHVQIHRRAEVLADRRVDVRPDLVLEQLMARRRDDADDLRTTGAGDLPLRELDELTERILGAEQLARERLVDDRDAAPLGENSSVAVNSRPRVTARPIVLK